MQYDLMHSKTLSLVLIVHAIIAITHIRNITQYNIINEHYKTNSTSLVYVNHCTKNTSKEGCIDTSTI